MIKVEVLTNADVLAQVTPKGLYDSESDWRERIAPAVPLGGVYAVRKDDAILLLMGGRPVWPGVWDLWAVTTDLMYDHPVAVTLAVRKFIEREAASRSVHRAQMYIRAGSNEAVAWARALGFIYEATLDYYGPDGADYYVYRRFF